MSKVFSSAAALAVAVLALAAVPAAALPVASGASGDVVAPLQVERAQLAIAAPHARGPQIAPPVWDRPVPRGNAYGYHRNRRVQRVAPGPAYGYYQPAPRAYEYYERPRRRVYREYYYD